MKTKKSKKTPPVVRDRIVELCRVRAGELRRHPQNWRLHPPAQQAAMAKVLGEVGYADALVARRLADGTLELIDGHLRAATTPDVEVPVLVVDLDDREAALLLAVHDSLTGMAETDDAMLAALLERVDADRSEVAALLTDVFDRATAALPRTDEPAAEPAFNELFQVVVECRDEADQRCLYERLTAEGRPCRLLML